jgi:hypothetical protein
MIDFIKLRSFVFKYFLGSAFVFSILMQCFTAQLNYIHYFSKHEMMYLFVQEDSEKAGRVTSAGMYFLHFQVYRMDSTVNAVCKLSLSSSLSYWVGLGCE